MMEKYGGRTNLEMDFFGGEPLMNWDVVKQLVEYATRVARCIDNDPMEGFWDILKRERYYGRRFTSKQDLIQMIERYIRYYNTRRVQRNLGMMTP